MDLVRLTVSCERQDNAARDVRSEASGQPYLDHLAVGSVAVTQQGCEIIRRVRIGHLNTDVGQGRCAGKEREGGGGGGGGGGVNI